MSDSVAPAEFDAVDIEVLRHQLESIARDMGSVLVRSAYSPNITERRDCSSALFDASGRLIAQAEHIPVHLGAMPDAVRAVREGDPHSDPDSDSDSDPDPDPEPDPGDVFVLNDPYAGGTHLPDITLVTAIAREGDIVGYAVTRAHHADVGAQTPGSMPAGSRTIHEEGIRLPPTRYATAGGVNEEVREKLLAAVRNPAQRRVDLRAQRAANDLGSKRLNALFDEYGDRLTAGFDAVLDYSNRRFLAELDTLPAGSYTAHDVLEGDGVEDRDVPIAVTVRITGEGVTVDFEGTASQVAGNVNAPIAVTKSAVYFVLRCVTDPDVPPNQGCYDPVTVNAPMGSLVNPKPPAAVAGGNVETSQRITDVVFEAFAKAVPERVPAQSQGTMNNLVIGSEEFTYYETIGGGSGASADGPGDSGVQVGMTNTLNTPIEALELAYPLRVEEYSIRRGSGGNGQYPGGDGLVRALRLEADATVSLLTDRRKHRPSGRAGGSPGDTGRNQVDGEVIPAKITLDVDAGTIVRVETPGGGGYGDVN